MIQIDLTGLRDVTRGIETDIGKAATGAMRGATRTAVRDLRRQVTDAGMSQRLANTWRDRVYPERRTSMVPTGYIWSNAPDIINAFASGATIRPVNGADFLWIPTKSVPRGRGSGRATSTKRMTPDEVERTFNTELVIRPGKQRGTLLAFLPPPARRNGRTRRPAGTGQKVVMKLMFVLRSSVKLDKVLDLDEAADRWAADYSAGFAREMGD